MSNQLYIENKGKDIQLTRGGGGVLIISKSDSGLYIVGNYRGHRGHRGHYTDNNILRISAIISLI